MLYKAQGINQRFLPSRKIWDGIYSLLTYECRRADDKRRQRAAVWRLGLLVPEVPYVMIAGQNADRLQSLSETHVVAEDAVQFVLVEECQPVHACLQTTK